jgi:proteic killer suppression protein
VIRNHIGLEHFFATGTKRGIQAKHAPRLRLILGALNAETTPQDLSLPGLGFRELRGDRRGTWAVKVSGNWRVTFRFAGKDADGVDYEDYHRSPHSCGPVCVFTEDSLSERRSPSTEIAAVRREVP